MAEPTDKQVEWVARLWVRCTFPMATKKQQDELWRQYEPEAYCLLEELEQQGLCVSDRVLILGEQNFEQPICPEAE